MDYLKNHCWCSQSHWDGRGYDCDIIVGINSYEEHNKEDWENITTTKEGFCESLYNINKSVNDKYGEGLSDEKLRRYSVKSYNTLKPEVIDWLINNVPDTKGNPMWCVGDEDYLMNDGCGMNIFFQKRKDAMLFIKTWSKWKKPVHYTQYFTDVRKTLNLTTLKYEVGNGRK